MTDIRMIQATVACEHGSLTGHWPQWMDDDGYTQTRYCEGGRYRVFPDPRDLMNALRAAAGFDELEHYPSKAAWEATLAKIAWACGNSTLNERIKYAAQRYGWDRPGEPA